ncbi:MAG: T9SS type A sorting domain-containing protein [Bacteroidales bacterium]|nr:T9SS type A sorting domain-containing protein [Bacteroidales bacterium]
MKKFIILLYLFLGLFIAIKAQTTQINLKKYWTYRDKLFKYFVYASSDVDRPGTNYPAMRIEMSDPQNQNKRMICFGDGNGGLQYYIGMLATEYRLLQIFGQSTDDTRDKLLWALQSVERLDKTAEAYFRPSIYSGIIEADTETNGFFIRDDMSISSARQLFDNVKFDSIESTLQAYMNIGYNYDSIGDFEESKDNVWHYLLNLALVVKLVDDVTINEKAKDIAYKMVKHMHAGDFGWYIFNPVTGTIVRNGEKGRGIIDEAKEFSGVCWGFAEAGGAISGRSLHHEWMCLGDNDCMEDSRDRDDEFKLNLSASQIPLELFGFEKSITDYLFESLATVRGFSDIGNGQNGFEFMLDQSHIFLGGEDKRHVIFPLVYAVLHDKVGYFYETMFREIERYTDILNQAPMCGTSDASGPWWDSDNSLVWLDRAGHVSGFYNGIDVMLLHNLFWLAYYADYYVEAINYSSPIESGRNININNCVWDINISSQIDSGAYVHIHSGDKIILNQGFHAKRGSEFFAKPFKRLMYKPTEICDTCEYQYDISYLKLAMNQPDIENSVVDDIQSQVPEAITENSKSGNSILYDLKIYPNPSGGQFTIEFEDIENIEFYSINNSLGQIIYNNKPNDRFESIDLGSHSKGLYIIKVIRSDHSIEAVKLLIK